MSDRSSKIKVKMEGLDFIIKVSLVTLARGVLVGCWGMKEN